MPVDAVRIELQGGGTWALNLIIGFIMFGVALDLKGRDFVRIFRTPLAPLIGLVAQFLLLPAATYVLTWALWPEPSIALGMILVAACPGGNVSNFLTHFARGNTALSVTMTACSTVAAVLLTPLNLQLWGGWQPLTAPILTEVRLESAEMFQTIGLILGLPIVLGMLCARLWPLAAQRMQRPFQVLSLVIFGSFVVLALTQNFQTFLDYVPQIAGMVFLQNAAALALGYLAGWGCGLPERDRRAISIEVGIQNSALGLALAFRYFESLGGVALVAAWWGVWHIVAGMTLASLWARRPPADATQPDGV